MEKGKCVCALASRGELTAIRFGRGVGDQLLCRILRCPGSLGGAGVHRTPALDAEEAQLGRMALHAIALEHQSAFEIVGLAEFIGGRLAALSRSGAKRKPVAFLPRPLEIANLPVLHDGPVALCELRRQGVVQAHGAYRKRNCAYKCGFQHFHRRADRWFANGLTTISQHCG